MIKYKEGFEWLRTTNLLKTKIELKWEKMNAEFFAAPIDHSTKRGGINHNYCRHENEITARERIKCGGVAITLYQNGMWRITTSKNDVQYQAQRQQWRDGQPIVKCSYWSTSDFLKIRNYLSHSFEDITKFYNKDMSYKVSDRTIKKWAEECSIYKEILEVINND